ncbi:MAG: hypothetical protein NUW09_04180 [Deltaproteobacteria bacterium]|nr:hypothetical protein [Deltaproteobacteria bacterium]
MLNLFDITKVLEEDEKICFTFEISRSHLQGFILLMQGLSEINSHLCASIRRAENRKQAKLDTMEREKNNRDLRVKKAIREQLKTLREKGLPPMEAFKEIRKEEELKHLVRQVQDEERIKTELEIIRLHGHGFKSHEISLKVPMSAGAIRKILGRLNHPAPLAQAHTAPRPRYQKEGQDDKPVPA